MNTPGNLSEVEPHYSFELQRVTMGRDTQLLELSGQTFTAENLDQALGQFVVDASAILRDGAATVGAIVGETHKMVTDLADPKQLTTLRTAEQAYSLNSALAALREGEVLEDDALASAFRIALDLRVLREMEDAYSLNSAASVAKSYGTETAQYPLHVVRDARVDAEAKATHSLNSAESIIGSYATNNGADVLRIAGDDRVLDEAQSAYSLNSALSLINSYATRPHNAPMRIVLDTRVMKEASGAYSLNSAHNIIDSYATAEAQSGMEEALNPRVKREADSAHSFDSALSIIDNYATDDQKSGMAYDTAHRWEPVVRTRLQDLEAELTDVEAQIKGYRESSLIERVLLMRSYKRLVERKDATKLRIDGSLKTLVRIVNTLGSE